MTEQTEEQIERKPVKPFDPIGSLMRHWLKIAIFGSVLFILFSPVALLKEKSFYKAEGKLMIAPSVQTLISNTETNPITGSYSGYVRTQCERIKAKEIVEASLAQLDEKYRKNLPPAIVLSRQLKAEAENGTYFISISLEGDSPDGLAEAVNKIMEVYIEKDIAEAEGQESRRIEYLQEERTLLEEQISLLTEKFKQISEAIGSVDFREAGNIHNKTLESLQQAHIDAYAFRITKENNLQAVIREADAIRDLSIDADVEDFVLNSSVASQMDIQTYQQIQSLQESLAGLSENNPDRKIIEEQIANLSESLDYSKDMLKTRTHQIMLSKRESRLREKIAIAESEFEAARSAENQLKTKLEAAIRDKAIISEKILDGQQIENELEKKQELLTRIEDRINELRMEARSPGRISLEKMAEPPGGPAGSNFKKLMMFCFVFAFGSVTFVCVLFDLTDKRIRSKKDILNAIGARVTWPISNYLLTRTEKTPFATATRDDSSNVVSKAIHSLAIRLDRERRENGAKLAIFTGVDAKSGTTEILINVAYAMTRLCKRVLVIDANLVNPAFDRALLDNSGAMGLVEHMREEVDYTESIIHSPERQFDVLPAGQLLLMSEINLVDRSKFPPMFETLKGRYDFILVDTPPVLVSDFTEFLLLNADIVSLVVQGDRSKYDSLFLVGDILNRLQVKAAAVVLNWGAPRERNFAQIAISRLLAPVTAKLNISPLWNPRHVFGSSSLEGHQGKRIVSFVLNLYKQIKKSVTNKKILLCLFVGLLFSAWLISGIIGNGPLQAKNVNGDARFSIRIENSMDEEEAGDNAASTTVPAMEAVGNASGKKIHQIVKVGQSTVQISENKVDSKRDHFLNENVLSLPASAYTIQLMGSEDRSYLLDVSKSHNISDDVICFQKKNGMVDWHVLIYKLFSDRSEAVACVETLAPELKSNQPWVRKLEDIQNEIAENTPPSEAGPSSPATSSFPKDNSI